MTLIPDKYQFTIWQGATFRTRVTVYTDDGVTLRDLTGYSAVMTIEDPQTDATLLSLTTSNGGISLGGAAGTIDLYISSTDTDAITWTGAVYELTITADGGDTDPLLYGNVLVKGV